MPKKGQGWHGEPRRHSLAARGIETPSMPRSERTIFSRDEIALRRLTSVASAADEIQGWLNYIWSTSDRHDVEVGFEEIRILLNIVDTQIQEMEKARMVTDTVRHHQERVWNAYVDMRKDEYKSETASRKAREKLAKEASELEAAARSNIKFLKPGPTYQQLSGRAVLSKGAEYTYLK